CYRDWSSDVCSSDLGLIRHKLRRQMKMQLPTFEIGSAGSLHFRGLEIRIPLLPCNLEQTASWRNLRKSGNNGTGCRLPRWLTCRSEERRVGKGWRAQ